MSSTGAPANDHSGLGGHPRGLLVPAAWMTVNGSGEVVGIMMGVWFLAASFGSKLAGYLSGFYVKDNAMQLVTLYGGIAAGLLISAAVLAFLTPKVKKLMGTVN
jgi:POT family proton-dependent oligopeptide transporter